jgi:hypothetical protein
MDVYCIVYVGCRVGIAKFSSFSILGMHIEGISIQHSTQSQCLLLARVTGMYMDLCYVMEIVIKLIAFFRAFSYFVNNFVAMQCH